jgi:NAD(P)-dependent dehydrogenase (short-subunit alcohol dehydrogenase family)
VQIEAQIANLFKKAMARFGRLDILVNNSGIFNSTPLDKILTEVWDAVIATNLRAAFLCTRAAFGIMKKQGGGRIINIGSISASRVRYGNAPYSCAKFGLMGLTQTTELEGREYNITCCMLNPGNFVRDDDPPDFKEPRMTQEDVAAGVVYMACLPPNVNVLEIIQFHKDQPYIGRG